MQASPDDIDIAALWQAVKRNGLRLLIAMAIAGAATWLVLASMAPQYRSSAQIILSRDASIYSRPRAELQPTAESLKIDQDEISSQVEVIQSADALQRIITDLALEKRPELNSALRGAGPITGVLRLLGLADADRKSPERERVFNAFRKSLVVYPVAKSHVIAIEFTSTDPKLAADIANAVANAYIESNRLQQLRRDADATDWIGSRIDELKVDAETADAALEKYRAQAGLLAGQNNVTLNTQQLSELNTQLSATRAQRSEAETRAREVRVMLASGDIDASPDILRSPIIQRLMEQRVAAEREVAELSATLLAKHPRMLQAASKLAKIKSELRREALKVVKSLENEAEIARSREAAVATSMRELTDKAEQSSESQAKLAGLERAAKSKRALFEAYLDRFNEASTRDQRAVPAYARLIAQAQPSSIPDFPKKLPSTLLAMAGMLLAGLGLIITRELMRAARGVSREIDRVRPLEDEVAPPSYIDPERRAAAVKQHQTLPEEMSLGVIAQKLNRRAINAPGQRTLVTSAGGRGDVPGTALKLARGLAKAGRSVVIVDAGVDGSGLAGSAGIAAGPGLREVIAGDARFEDVLVRDAESGVGFVPAGAPALATVAVEARDQLVPSLELLSESYEQVFVVISPARLKLLTGALSGAIDTAIEIGIGEGQSPAHRLLSEAGVEVLRYRPPTAQAVRPRAASARPQPPAAQ